MNQQADLHAALQFVTGRIAEDAVLSGEPLNAEQRRMLEYLPSSVPSMHSPDLGPAPLVPRNLDLERLCSLANRAHLKDVQLTPSSLDWNFAIAVLKLNRHPMFGLLGQAGVKYEKPWWDSILLFFAALLFVLATVTLMVFLLVKSSSWLRWVIFVCGYVACLCVAYIVSRRVEERQLLKEIERCRLRSRFTSTIAT